MPDNVIIGIFKQNGVKWDSNIAIDVFYSGGYANQFSGFVPAGPKISESSIKTLFNQFSSNGKIDMEGISKFFDAIGISLEDPVTVAISHVMEAKSCEWEYDMFKKGCEKNAAASIRDWKGAIPTLRQKMSTDNNFFTSVYGCAFDIS